MTVRFLADEDLRDSIIQGLRAALRCYCGFVDPQTHPIELSQTEQTVSPSFEELAAQQGVTPIEEFETLLGLGKPSPDDESAEEFSASLREWRLEGPRPANRR